MAEEKNNINSSGTVQCENGFQSRPVIMDAVCACGEKCFHEARYLYEDMDGCHIPDDACPINCRVSNLDIDPENIRRVGDCFEVCGSYKIRVWFEYTTERGISDVKMAMKTFHFKVQIPVLKDYGCILCNGNEVEYCNITRVLRCIKADLVKVHGCNAIKVLVEKHLFILEQGETLICLPVFPIEKCECIPPGSVSPDVCKPFSKEPECEEWCYEDEKECPGACNTCPPPQTDQDECVKDDCDKGHKD